MGRFKSSTPYIPSIVPVTNNPVPPSTKLRPVNAPSSQSSDNLINYDEDNAGRAINLPLHNDTLQQLGFFEYGGLKVDETPPCSPDKLASTSFSSNISDFDPFGQSSGSYANNVATIPPNMATVVDPFADTPSGDLFFGMSPPKASAPNPTSAFPFIAPVPPAATEFSAFLAPLSAPVADPFGGASVLLQPTVLHQPNTAAAILPAPVPASAPALAPSSSSSTPMNLFNSNFYPGAMNYSTQQQSWGGVMPPPVPGPGAMNMNTMNGFYPTGSNAMNVNNMGRSVAPSPFNPPQSAYNSSGMTISQMNIPAPGYRGEQHLGRPMAGTGRSMPQPPNDSFNFVAGAMRSQLDSNSNKF